MLRWTTAAAALALALMGVPAAHGGGPPDVTISNVTNPAAGARVGESLPVGYTIHNGGSTAAGARTVRVTLVGEGATHTLATDHVSQLGAGTSQRRSVHGTLRQAGSYRVRVCTGASCAFSRRRLAVRAVPKLIPIPIPTVTGPRP